MVWVEEEVQRGRAALLTLKLNTAVKIKWVCSILWRRALGLVCLWDPAWSLPAPTLFPHSSSHSFQHVSSVLFLLVCLLN